jgi:hypothetical protein
MDEDVRDVRRNQLWRHIKSGGLYRVTDIVRLEATKELLVVYQSCALPPKASHDWARPLAEFCDGRFKLEGAV